MSCFSSLPQPPDDEALFILRLSEILWQRGPGVSHVFPHVPPVPCCLELLQNLLVDSPDIFGSAADFGVSELQQHLDLQGLCRKQRLCLITALPEVYTGFSCALFLFFHPFKIPGTHSCLSLWKTLRSSVAEGVSPSCAYLFREIKV